MTIELLLAMSVAASPSFVGGRVTMAKTATTLLSGRLEVSLPEGATLQPRGHSIMAAAQASQDETRAVFDLDNTRFVVMAYELYATAGADFRASVTADLKQSWGEDAAKVKLEPLAVAKPLVALGLVPPPADFKAEASLLYAAYAAHPDGGVQFLAFYVNPEGSAKAADWVALAKGIAQSLTAGKRLLATQAGERSFPGASSDRLVVKVPEGWVTSTRDGPDFRVSSLRQLAPLGQAPTSCGIYLGGHPSYQWQQQEVGQEQVKSVAGTLFGVKVDWNEWSTAGRITTESMVAHPLEKSLMLHVFCSAAAPAGLASARQVMETLRVAK